MSWRARQKSSNAMSQHSRQLSMLGNNGLLPEPVGLTRLYMLSVSTAAVVDL